MKPGVLAFYRVMAYVTAVLLLLLCLAMVFKYLTASGSSPQQVGTTATRTIAIVHGYLYLVYLFIALVITVQLRIPLGRMVLVLLAGTIPFGAFIAERRVTLWRQLRLAGQSLDETPADGGGAVEGSRSTNS